MYFVEQNVRQKHKSVDKICFCRTNVRQIAYSCRQKFRQNTFLAGHWSGKVPTKHIFVDKIRFVEQSSGKIEICRQNMLCRTFFRQKYALSDISVEQNVRQNHTVDKCMLSGPAGPGGRAARWQAQPAGPESYCRQIYAFRAGRPRRPGCLYHSVHGILIYILNSNLHDPPVICSYLVSVSGFSSRTGSSGKWWHLHRALNPNFSLLLHYTFRDCVFMFAPLVPTFYLMVALFPPKLLIPSRRGTSTLPQ